MCDLKLFYFLHHFGSGFKYFSAVIICKLSKILNLRLSGGAHIQIYIHGKPWGQPTKALSVLSQAGQTASDISKLRRAGKSVESRFG